MRAIIGSLQVFDFVDMHIGVGFGVARSDYSGDARASKGGTSNRLDSHASFFMCSIYSDSSSFGSTGGTYIKTNG